MVGSTSHKVFWTKQFLIPALGSAYQVEEDYSTIQNGKFLGIFRRQLTCWNGSEKCTVAGFLYVDEKTINSY